MMDDMGAGVCHYIQRSVISVGNIKQIRYILKFVEYLGSRVARRRQQHTHSQPQQQGNRAAAPQHPLFIPAVAALPQNATWSSCGNVLLNDGVVITNENLSWRGFVWPDFLSVVSDIQCIEVHYTEGLLSMPHTVMLSLDIAQYFQDSLRCTAP